jgi:hypothetical protein
MPESITQLTEEQLQQSSMRLRTGSKIYSPTESALDAIMQHSDDQRFCNAVHSLKNKAQFRQLMQTLYPDFFFQTISLDELPHIALDRSRKYIVKPVKGFFGTAVKEISPETDLHALHAEIAAELQQNSQYFSSTILSRDQLIIEQYASGEEIAVDMYFNEAGEPEILNIYHHPFPQKQSYFHVLYYTNKALFDTYLAPVKAIFAALNKELKITNFPIHAEFKVDGQTIVPIEMNPLRYGGFGLADLTFHGFNINPFTAFFENRSIDWDAIWQEHGDITFGWVLAYNGDAIDPHTHAPLHAEFQDALGTTLHYIKMDHRQHPVFAMAYVKRDSLDELEFLLKLEFSDFFEVAG